MRLFMLVLSGLCLARCHAADDANITSAAEVTCHPEVAEGRLPSVTDGRVGTGFAFEVGTSGDGWVAFDFGRTRAVTGLRFYQHNEVYYATEYIIEADADGDGEFELTLAEGADPKINDWSQHSWDAAQVRVVRLRSVKGVSGGKRAHPCLAEVVVQGSPLPGDAARAYELGNPVVSVGAPRDIQRGTSLVVDGRAPVVIAGEDDDSRQAASNLAQGLAGVVGAKVAVVGTLDEAGLGERTVIAVGNCVTNPLVARLYHNRRAFEDYLSPGPGGYTLRTVCDPYPWRGGMNVIVVGGGDAEGVDAGVARLLEIAGETNELPWLLEVSGEARPSAADARAATAKAPDPTFTAFLAAAEEYQRWGHEEYARKAIAALDLMAAIYAANPVRDIPWNEETNSGAIFAAWEAFEPCPLLTDAQRLEYTRAFLYLLNSIPKHTSGYAKLERSDLVAWNHTTFPLLGLYFGGRYFQHYHHITVCDDYLAKARACFGAQARSWKPQEDADSYITCTMTHTSIRYFLAEGLDEFVSGGNMARYADYMIGICDSRGWAGGFGDSHYSSNSGLLTGLVPDALLTTGDAGYRWVTEHINRKWVNPYQQAVGVRPDRFVGVNVFPLDEQVHEFTQSRSYYNEPLVKSEVPVERAWDKISFRESWDPDAQYLLMDGFGRGKHLHYDTNCINEYVADGERWLADHDYLVRNSTEHCMLSVLRDGRGNTLIPSMAELVCAADLPGWGIARTKVPGYSGLDWDRAVIWRKGQYFVVTDGVTAREAGEYDLELTWKIEDQHNQWLEDGRVFVADRGPAAAKTVGITIVDDPEASGGRAVVMGRSSSRLAMRVELPAGKYRAHVRGKGSDGSHDSIWLRVDGGEAVALGLSKGRYGGPIGGGSAPASAADLVIPDGAVHVLLVALREMAPVHLDRITLYREEQEALTIEAEDVEPLRPDDVISTGQNRFWIKSAEPVASHISTHESTGISIALCTLHQRQNRQMLEGDNVRFASLLSSVSDRRAGEYDLGRAGEGRYLVSGDDRAFIALDELRVAGIRCRASVIVIEPDALCLAGGTLLELGGERWASDEPRNVGVDLNTGEITVYEEPGAASVVGSEAGGRLSLTDANRAAVVELLAGATEAFAADGAEGAAEATPSRWTCRFPEKGEIRRLQTADIDGDGVEEILVAQGRWCHCLEPDGTIRWSFAVDDLVRDVADVEARPSPGREVALATADTHIYVLSADGKLLDKHQPRAPVRGTDYGDRPCQSWVVEGLDLDGDGVDELVAALGNFTMAAFDQDWSVLWVYKAVAHGAMDVKLVDWDGDGRDEIFVADKYGFVHGISREGGRVFIGYSSIGDVQFDMADLPGAGLSVIYGSSTGDMLARGHDKKIAWRFDNYGYAVRRIRAADLDADGDTETLMASATGYLYALDHEGTELWRDSLGFAVNDVVVAPLDAGAAPAIVAAGEGGLVRVYGPDGTILREIVTPSSARLLSVYAQAQGAQMLMATSGGEVVSY